MSRYGPSYSSGVTLGSFDRPEQSVSTIMNNISKEFIRKRIVRGSVGPKQTPSGRVCIKTLVVCSLTMLPSGPSIIAHRAWHEKQK